ncbi:secretory calcium-binding phosphoprotein 5 [Colossoma macropomum]|uniref:secretory calcium-binding phosphoprotein 5 n=1 Tax=Colossoma macropomum TaxID=42526 RepID=UPI001863C175|nr:secretory calcium-binding phosphoprotein 5 [Colossoma macropomum]
MLGSILCLSFVTVVSAAPMSPFFNYLPHYGKPAGPSAQPAYNAPISMEIVFPPQFPHTAGGAGAGASFPSQGYIKYSLPKAPGAQSVEVYYPYDFTQQGMGNIPVLPPLPGLVTFDNPQQTGQQQPPRAAPQPSEADVLNDQPAQTGQTPTHP